MTEEGIFWKKGVKLLRKMILEKKACRLESFLSVRVHIKKTEIIRL